MGEMQEMAEGVFDALQRYGDVIVRYFAKVEEDVVEGLQQVVTAFGADQMYAHKLLIFSLEKSG
jgi:hypothetical protein